MIIFFKHTFCRRGGVLDDGRHCLDTFFFCKPLLYVKLSTGTLNATTDIWAKISRELCTARKNVHNQKEAFCWFMLATYWCL